MSSCNSFRSSLGDLLPSISALQDNLDISESTTTNSTYVDGIAHVGVVRWIFGALGVDFLHKGRPGRRW